MSVQKFVARNNEEWRAERSHSIGASAVGILLGENPWTTPLELADRMRAELAGRFDYTQTLAMMRGHAYEQGVADLFQWTTGHQVIKASGKEYILRRDDIPFMHASPDRTYWIDDSGAKHGKNAEANKGLLECKTTRRPVDPDSLPMSWVFQLQVQMGISGMREGYIAWDVLTSADGFDYCRFDYDPVVFEAAVDVCRDFWERCIVGGQQPEPVNARDVIAMYPRHTEGKTIQADSETAGIVASIREAKAVKKELDEQLDELADRLKVRFEDAEALVDGDGKVLATYKASAPRTTVDSKKLKEEYPEAYAACRKEGAGTRTLIIK